MSAIGLAIRCTIVAIAGLGCSPAWAINESSYLEHISLPPGFRIEVYAEVPGARTLTIAPELGAVFVGTFGRDIYTILDRDLDGNPRRAINFRNNLNSPNGLVWHDGHLYVAETHRIIRYRGEFIEELVASPPQVLFDRFPTNPHHGWRFIAVGPDNNLYVTVGAPCNICPVSGLEASIIQLPLTGGEPRVFARGIRNSVGIDFHPQTGILHFTDNGADGMGDDSPPDELNRAERAGTHFGFPWYGGGNDRTPDFQRHILAGRTTPPVEAFGAHVTPLGLDFYDGTQFPAEYRGDAFIAQHGSSSRSIPDGYRIVRARFDANGNTVGYETFASGWLRPNGSFWGRPVDIEELPDGSLLISDDHAGVIYRVTYTN